MKKRVLVRGPVLTLSGYGEHARFVLRALKKREDELDIYIVPTIWGETGWLNIDDEEREWIDERVLKATAYMANQGAFDLSIQVTIPNEWQLYAPINVGVTAGIETDRVSPVWLEKSNAMNKVITISEHSKRGFINTNYDGQNKDTGAPVHLTCETPVEIVHYPAKTNIFDNLKELDLNLDYDFNFLSVAQWGPRKNLENTVKWFIEENIDQKVGLVVKTHIKNGSVVDRKFTQAQLEGIVSNYPDKKCKVYLLHGDLSDEEMHSLYKHPKIKSLISLTHGEGFGLPIFEAAYSGLPIIASDWSGHIDFLYTPFESKSNKSKKKHAKTKMHPSFANVEFTLGPIPPPAVWPGVLEENSMWCYAHEGSYKMKLRQVRKNYSKWTKKAAHLQEWILENFDYESQCEKLAAAMVDDYISPESEEGWLAEIESIVQEYE